MLAVSADPTSVLIRTEVGSYSSTARYGRDGANAITDLVESVHKNVFVSSSNVHIPSIKRDGADVADPNPIIPKLGVAFVILLMGHRGHARGSSHVTSQAS